MIQDGLDGKRALVMGLGVHGGGLGVTQWLVEQGAVVTVTDLRSAEQLKPSLDALRGLPVRYVLGEHREQDFQNADLIVRNPGVPRESPWLELAKRLGIPVEMEMGLFVRRLPRGAAQVIGITGTKGKTTTTLMVGAMLGKQNRKTVVAGNLRISALELLRNIDADTPVVLELSSWQLEGLEPHEASPHIATITNISPDHLNRYRDLDDYAQAKAVVFRYQHPDDYLVLNLDNKTLTDFAPRSTGRVVWTSSQHVLNEGAYRAQNALFWSWAGRRSKILDLSELRVPGVHNIENALAAMATAAVWGVSPEQMAEALAEFRGVEHRQELVGELDGVRYINDTTATAPAAAVAAIRAQSASASAILLIAGGSDKGLDFADMADAIAHRVQHVFLLDGEGTDRLAAALQDAGASSTVEGRYDNLPEAVERARRLSKRGDVILLSPGCASFGMFANEFERGDLFKRIVAELTLQAKGKR